MRLLCLVVLAAGLTPSWALGDTPAAALPGAPALDEPAPRTLDLDKFEVVKRESGPVNYYSVVSQDGLSFIHAAFRPHLRTTILGYELPASLHHGVHKFRWRWRALALPTGADECKSGKEDNAATVFLLWKSGLRWYSLRYLWSTVGTVGAVCSQHRNLFLVADSVIVHSGGPVGQWLSEEIDPTAEFIRHFRDGDPKAEVPALVGVGILTDGDQTGSEASADYTDFTLQ